MNNTDQNNTLNENKETNKTSVDVQAATPIVVGGIQLPPAFNKITTGLSTMADAFLSHDTNGISSSANTSNTSSAKFSGLSNQGSTCYLNSLLQSLFMTPEFRLNLLNWKFDEESHGSKNDCIPYQLQKLFARLQLRLRYAEETKDLTKSFQWDSGEVFLQHDIQELCRKLFEAIELSLGPDDNNFINDLYEGNTVSIVKCLECGYMSEKYDKFLDIVLPIRNDFEKIYNKSLTMALSNFLKPELLNEGNQYFCGKCSKKVDASKYMKFTKLPKILFVSMSRFEYDFTTDDSRKKINDKVTFPLVLNLNNYMKEYEDIKYDSTIDENENECLLLKDSESNTIKVNSEESKGESKNESDLNFHDTLYKQKIEKYYKEGPNVYELFSIVIHSGTALGGHYYAYIKSYDDGKWYSFNDSTVTGISVNEIKKCFGGLGTSDTRYSSSTTGYVLMYRLANFGSESSSISYIDNNLINNDLKKDIDEDTEKLLEEERKWKEKMSNLTLKVYYKNEQKTLVVKKTDTVSHLKLEMMKAFGIEESFRPEDVRVRAYNQYGNKPLEFYHEEDSSLEANSIISYKTYTLDFRNKETGKFDEFDPNMIYINIYGWKDENFGKTEEELECDIIKISNKTTLEQLKKRICDIYGYNFYLTPLHIFRKVEISQNNFSIVELFKPGEDLSKELFKCAMLDNTKLFVEVKDTAENYQSKFYEILAEKLSYMTIKFNFPVDKDRLAHHKVNIHDYKMENEMQAKRTNPMAEVKQKIADFLALKPEEFIMRKYNHNGAEIRNLNETLIEVSGTTSLNFLIYVEFGNPMGANELLINVNLCELDFSVFKLFPYRFTELGLKLINTDWTIAELKKHLIEEVKEKTSIELDSNYVLIRETVTDRPSRILHDSLIIRDLGYSDKKKILIQEYKKEKLEFDPNQIQVTIRHWDTENWILSDPVEIHVTQRSKLLELAGKINAHFPEIHVMNILKNILNSLKI